MTPLSDPVELVVDLILLVAASTLFVAAMVGFAKYGRDTDD